MSWLKFFRRRAWHHERSREIDSYLEMETADNLARGMPPPEAAEAALRKFGNPMYVREEIYQMNTLPWLENAWQDLRYGTRLLIADPGFALVAILSLALGIGANTAIFQLLDAVRLRNLPVHDPRQLAEVRIAGGNGGLGENGAYGELTRPMWEELQRSHPAFSGMFAWSPGESGIGEGANFRLVRVLNVSADFFNVLGVAPSRGRLLSAADNHACPASTAMVSYGYWQSEMGARPIDSNTRLMIDGASTQIIGVTPPSFLGLAVGEHFDVVFPFCRPTQLARNVFDITVMGRLRPGWTLEKASGQLLAQSPGIMAATQITGYDARSLNKYLAFRLNAFSANAGVSNLRKDYSASLWLLLGITGLVLLIACANLANLMLARASTREREIALRLALGASRFRLIRQLLVESALIAVTGAALGLALAELLSRVMVRSLSTSDDSAVTLAMGIDWRVLLFTAIAATLTCIVFGTIPAVRASNADPVDAMKSGGRGMTAGRERYSGQRLMVLTQIAVSMVLIVAALLFVKSFVNLLTFNPGMREDNITDVFIGFQPSHIPPSHISDFKRTLLNEVQSIPGVLSAATTTMVPLLGSSWSHEVTIGSMQGSSQFTWVSPGYFQTMGIPLLSGRDFNDRDTSTSEGVAVVNQEFIRRYLNGINPIGRIMRTHPEPNYPATTYRIVGVIPNTSYSCLRCGMPPMTFAPGPQLPAQRPWTAIMVHSNQSSRVIEDAVKRRIAESHPEVIVQTRAFKAQIGDGLVRDRLMAMVSGFFGFLAVLLGSIGLYGLIAYRIARRRNEIGIRVAVGASRGQVIAMVMREAGGLLVSGVMIGVVLSIAAGRSANALLFGLKPYDTLTLVTAAGVLVLIGIAASFIPAFRAAHLDPMAALRAE